MFTRREFIKAGIAGTVLLTFLRGIPARAALTEAAPQDGRNEVFAALIPVLLAGALPEEAKARSNAIKNVEAALREAIAGLAPKAQAELADLFRLFSIAPLSWLLTGIGNWREATPEAVTKFLERWRFSLWTLQQSGYQALTQLTLAAWYGNPDAWTAIGYAGPPPLEH